MDNIIKNQEDNNEKINQRQKQNEVESIKVQAVVDEVQRLRNERSEGYVKLKEQHDFVTDQKAIDKVREKQRPLLNSIDELHKRLYLFESHDNFDKTDWTNLIDMNNLIQLIDNQQQKIDRMTLEEYKGKVGTKENIEKWKSKKKNEIYAICTKAMWIIPYNRKLKLLEIKDEIAKNLKLFEQKINSVNEKIKILEDTIPLHKKGILPTTEFKDHILIFRGLSYSTVTLTLVPPEGCKYNSSSGFVCGIDKEEDGYIYILTNRHVADHELQYIRFHNIDKKLDAELVHANEQITE